MRILHIIETLNLGGAEKVVVDLCNSMVNEHVVGVCCIKSVGVIASKLSENVIIECLHRREGNPVGFVFRIISLISRFKPDVVHLHSLGMLLEVSLAVGLLPRIVYIVTCHGHLSHYSTNRFKRSIRRYLEVPALLSVNKIVTVSDEVANLLPPAVAGSFVTIYNGVQVGTLRHKNAFSKNIIELVFAGRLAKVKKLDNLIKAIKLVEDNIEVKLRCQIIGEGPEAGFLKNLVRELFVRTEIKFVGYVDDVRSYYENCDIFILPSEYEGISIALLEAMAESLAVIVTNVGGNTEVVEPNISGIVVEADDIRGLADAISRLACNVELRNDVAVNGYERVKMLFNLEVSACRYLQLYQNFNMV